MVKEIKLLVNDGWTLPESIKKLDPESVEALLDSIDSLLLDNMNKNNALNQEQLQQNIVRQYKLQIKKLIEKYQGDIKKSSDEYQNEINQLQKELTKVKTHSEQKINNEIKFVQEQNENQLQRYIKQYNNEIEDLRNQLKVSNDKTFELNEHYQNKIKFMKDETVKEINTKYINQINELKKTNDFLYEQLKNITANNEVVLNDKVEQKIKAIENEKNILINMYEKQLSDSKKYIEQQLNLQKQLQPIVKMYYGSNEEKGSAGEQTVYNFIRDDPKYDSAILTDKSGETATGDLYFSWKDLRCLIEIKNKKRLTVDDMKKFERDVREQKAIGKINCALFVSLATNDFPGRNKELIQFDVIDNIPVIYTYLSDVKFLHYSFICLSNIVKTITTDLDKYKMLITYYQSYTKKIQYYVMYFGKLIKSHETSIRSLKKELNTLTNLETELISNSNLYFNSIDVLSNQVNQLDSSSDSDSDSDSDSSNSNNSDEKLLMSNDEQINESFLKLVNWFIKYSINNKHHPSISDILTHFNITSYQLIKKFGGYKHLIKEAIKKYLYDNISQETIQQIKNYHTVNGEYPKRQYLTKNYISHRQLTKFGYIIKGKKIMEFIYKFIEDESS